MHQMMMDTKIVGKTFNWKCPCCALGIYGNPCDKINTQRRIRHGKVAHPGVPIGNFYVKPSFDAHSAASKRAQAKWTPAQHKAQREKYALAMKQNRIVKMMADSRGTGHTCELLPTPWRSAFNKDSTKAPGTPYDVYCTTCGKKHKDVKGLGKCEPDNKKTRGIREVHLKRFESNICKLPARYRDAARDYADKVKVAICRAKDAQAEADSKAREHTVEIFTGFTEAFATQVPRNKAWRKGKDRWMPDTVGLCTTCLRFKFHHKTLKGLCTPRNPSWWASNMKSLATRRHVPAFKKLWDRIQQLLRAENEAKKRAALPTKKGFVRLSVDSLNALSGATNKRVRDEIRSTAASASKRRRF